jgi:hypothetical protein
MPLHAPSSVYCDLLPCLRLQAGKSRRGSQKLDTVIKVGTAGASSIFTNVQLPVASRPARACTGLTPCPAPDVQSQVGGLPRGITPPEVLQLFWGWQAKVAGTYVDPAGSGPHVEVCSTLPVL